MFRNEIIIAKFYLLKVSRSDWQSDLLCYGAQAAP